MRPLPIRLRLTLVFAGALVAACVEAITRATISPQADEVVACRYFGFIPSYGCCVHHISENPTNCITTQANSMKPSQARAVFSVRSMSPKSARVPVM